MFLLKCFFFFLLLVMFISMISFIIIWIVFFPLRNDFKKMFRENGYNYNYYDGKNNLGYKHFNLMIESCCNEISNLKPMETKRFLKVWRPMRKILIGIFSIIVLFICIMILFVSKGYS